MRPAQVPPPVDQIERQRCCRLFGGAHCLRQSTPDLCRGTICTAPYSSADLFGVNVVEHQPNRRGTLMNIHLSLAPIVSLIAGILILAAPRLLNFIVAIYLIVIGLIGLFGAGSLHI
jgi:hypothetical protein